MCSPDLVLFIRGHVGQTYDAPWWGKWGTRGALTVATAAATIAGGAVIWNAAGGPTMSIGFGVPPMSITPHFVWSVTARGATTTYHVWNKATAIASPIWAGYLGGNTSITGIPILAPGAAGALGVAAWNCFTGACGALRRGLIGF